MQHTGGAGAAAGKGKLMQQGTWQRVIKVHCSTGRLGVDYGRVRVIQGGTNSMPLRR